MQELLINTNITLLSNDGFINCSCFCPFSADVNVDKSDMVAEERMEVQVKEQETDEVFEILKEEDLRDEEDSELTEETKKLL